jgi:hypothetical protein
MRSLTIGLLAAVGIAMAIPASAQSVSVGVSAGEHRDRDRVEFRHRDRDRVEFRERHRHDRVTVGLGERRHCRVTIIHRDGMTKKIKRCD